MHAPVNSRCRFPKSSLTIDRRGDQWSCRCQVIALLKSHGIYEYCFRKFWTRNRGYFWCVHKFVGLMRLGWFIIIRFRVSLIVFTREASSWTMDRNSVEIQKLENCKRDQSDKWIVSNDQCSSSVVAVDKVASTYIFFELKFIYFFILLLIFISSGKYKNSKVNAKNGATRLVRVILSTSETGFLFSWLVAVEVLRVDQFYVGRLAISPNAIFCSKFASTTARTENWKSNDALSASSICN